MCVHVQCTVESTWKDKGKLFLKQSKILIRLSFCQLFSVHVFHSPRVHLEKTSPAFFNFFPLFRLLFQIFSSVCVSSNDFMQNGFFSSGPSATDVLIFCRADDQNG